MTRPESYKSSKSPIRFSLLKAAAIFAIVLSACDVGADPSASPLEDLQLIGVDFELNSMIISNNSDSEVRTQGLWAYRDGESFEFNIFILEPRSTILFSMQDLGDISASGGEMALAESDSFDDPEALLQYVAWGEADLDLSRTATGAGLWPPDAGTVDVDTATIILVRTDPTGTGPDSWQSSSEIP